MSGRKVALNHLSTPLVIGCVHQLIHSCAIAALAEDQTVLYELFPAPTPSLACPISKGAESSGLELCTPPLGHPRIHLCQEKILGCPFKADRVRTEAQALTFPIYPQN